VREREERRHEAARRDWLGQRHLPRLGAAAGRGGGFGGFREFRIGRRRLPTSSERPE
jgi:hypothetical protein